MELNKGLEQAQDEAEAEWIDAEKALTAARECIHTKVQELVGRDHDKRGSDRLRQNYVPSVPIVYSRVKSVQACRDRIADRYRTLSEFPDLIGCRVVVIHTEEIDDVRSQLAELTRLVSTNDLQTIDHDKGVGRARGYAGRFYWIRLERWIQAFAARYTEFKHDLTPEKVEMIAKYNFELQIHTVMEEAWSRVSHAGFYKTKEGIPNELKRKLLRLASTSRLIGDHMRDLSMSIYEARDELSKSFDNPKTHDDTEVDEFLLWYCHQKDSRYRRFLESYREMGQTAGFNKSDWPELVRVGDDTDICLEVCERTGLRNWGKVDEAFFSIDNHGDSEHASSAEMKREWLKSLVAVCREERSEPPIATALLVFSILRLLEYPSLPSIDTMHDSLWKQISKVHRDLWPSAPSAAPTRTDGDN